MDLNGVDKARGMLQKAPDGFRVVKKIGGTARRVYVVASQGFSRNSERLFDNSAFAREKPENRAFAIRREL
jgi:hypothetical protein